MDLLSEVKKEISDIEEKSGFSSPSDVHLLADLMYLKSCLECEEKESWELEQAESEIKQLSNSQFDRNINELYDSYIECRMMYGKESDYVHKEKMIDSLNRLMVEVYDLVCTIHTSAMLTDERDIIKGFTEKMFDLSN
jgi:hypothetical protein